MLPGECKALEGTEQRIGLKKCERGAVMCSNGARILRPGSVSRVSSSVTSHLRRPEYQVLVLLLPLSNRLVQRYHKRHITLIRLFQQKQLGDVVVLDLVVVSAEDRLKSASDDCIHA